MTKRNLETGNYYYGARYYDPKVSVWLSVDPLAHEFSPWTPYHFVHNNPLNLVDPNGMSATVPGEEGEKPIIQGSIPAVEVVAEKPNWFKFKSAVNSIINGGIPSWGKGSQQHIKNPEVEYADDPMDLSMMTVGPESGPRDELTAFILRSAGIGPADDFEDQGERPLGPPAPRKPEDEGKLNPGPENPQLTKVDSSDTGVLNAGGRKGIYRYYRSEETPAYQVDSAKWIPLN